MSFKIYIGQKFNDMAVAWSLICNSVSISFIHKPCQLLKSASGRLLFLADRLSNYRLLYVSAGNGVLAEANIPCRCLCI